jgi:predicted aldo/keto reductase-like oxidoreductase
MGKCPQNFEIPDFLANVADKLEDSEIQNRLAAAKQMFKIEAP